MGDRWLHRDPGGPDGDSLWPPRRPAVDAPGGPAAACCPILLPGGWFINMVQTGPRGTFRSCEPLGRNLKVWGTQEVFSGFSPDCGDFGKDCGVAAGEQDLDFCIIP